MAEFAAGEIGAEVFGWNLPNWLLRREMVARVGRRLARRGAGGAGDAAHRGGAGGAVGRHAGAGAPRRRGGRARQRGARGARDRRAALGLRAEGAGLLGDARAAARAGSRPRSTARAVRSRWCRSPTATGRTPRPWSGWRRGRGRRSWRRCRRTAFDAALNLRACGVLGELRLAGRRMLWPIIAQIADRLDGPRTALVAEAAHVVPPIGAQGLNMSLADIATLVELCAARARGRDIGGAGAAPPLPPGAARRGRCSGSRGSTPEPRGDGRRAAAARPAAGGAAGAPRDAAAPAGGDAARARGSAGRGVGIPSAEQAARAAIENRGAFGQAGRIILTKDLLP